MRVTFAMNYDRMAYNINRKREDIDRLGTAVASGKRLHKPSDDPAAWAQAMDIKQRLREFDSFENNMDFSLGWNQTTSGALDHLFDLLTQVRETAVAANKPLSQEQRDGYVATLNQLLRDAVSTANTQYEGRYIFSVNSDDPPIGLDTNGDDVTGVRVNGISVDAVVYPDDMDNLSDELQVRIGKDRMHTVNRDGQRVFYDDPSDWQTNLFQQIVDLKNAIQAGDTTTLEDRMGDVIAAQERISDQSSLTGSLLSSLEWQKNALNDLRLDETTRLSDIEEADLPEVILQLQQKRTAFEAALQVTGMLDELSLVRFI